MRTFLAVTLLVLGGCSGPTPTTASGAAGADALDCALAEATAFGYAVVDAEAGVFFRARQSKRFRFRRGDTEFDVLTATAARGRLTVIATGEESSADGDQATDPSAAAREEAEAVVSACTA